MKNEKNHIYSHAFSCAGGFGQQKIKRLQFYFENLEEAWKASSFDLGKAGIGEKCLADFLVFRQNCSPEKLFQELLKEKIDVITFQEESYPPLLKEIPSPPAIIYTRGNKEILTTKSLAVVGSRKYTAYGEQVTKSFCRDIVRSGLCVVSGLALGIDGIAHQASLDDEGPTIAVLGTGIDDGTIYPREHFNLARNILESEGVLMTEYPPRTPSLKQNFPARNRIMAGLTLGTLVVEAALNSGSLITAGLALEFGREVFAVPGPVFSPQSDGTNFLIKNGAKLSGSASDILEELNLDRFSDSVPKKIFDPKTREEKAIWKALGSDPLHVDRIAKLTKLNPATVGSVLATMEIEGVVKNIGGQNYIRL